MESIRLFRNQGVEMTDDFSCSFGLIEMKLKVSYTLKSVYSFHICIVWYNIYTIVEHFGISCYIIYIYYYILTYIECNKI